MNESLSTLASRCPESNPIQGPALSRKDPTGPSSKTTVAKCCENLSVVYSQQLQFVDRLDLLVLPARTAMGKRLVFAIVGPFMRERLPQQS